MNYLCFEEDAMILFNAQRVDKLLHFRYSPFAVFEADNTRMRSPDINFHALLGVKILGDIPFLMVAEEAEPCCNIGTSTIYEIKKIDWIPIVKKEQLESALDRTEDKIKDMAKLFEEGYHYFSDLYRLNTTYYFNIMNEENADERKFYSQFIFNQSLMELGEQCSLASWCKPIIQGYIEQFSAKITSTESLSYTIISRRSNKKQGTRYFARGIDDKGNVANFTETQQIIGYGQFMISNVQIRGSVPAFFEQVGISGLKGQLNVTRNQAMTQKAFQTHFAKLNSVYNRIFCVNLLSIKKSQEERLTLFFESLVNLYSPSYIRYQYFDFHEECKNNQFENSERLIEKIKRVITSFGITVFDTKLKKLISKQTGVIRTNCLDCLDRTNYMQSRIALYAFERIIQNFSIPEVRDQVNRYQLFKNKQESSSEVLSKFNSAWAENGDKISLHYTGIGSTHTDITKLGKRTLKGTVNHKMRSLMRFFVQFSDPKKHEAIQTITNNPLMRSRSVNASEPLTGFVNIAIMTFDLNLDNSPVSNVERCRFVEDYVQLKKPAAVVIFGYRKNSSGGLLKWFKGEKPHEDVRTFTEQQIAVVKKLGYQIIKQIMSESNCMLIFGNSPVIQNVTEIKNQNVSTSKDTMTICKFNLGQLSLAFSGVNCTSFQSFEGLLEKSHNEAFQYDRLGQAKSSSILTHHYRTVMGNMASGNKLSDHHYEQMSKQINYMKSKGDNKAQLRLINQMLDGDELSNSFQQNYNNLKNYMEGPVYFPPSGNRIIFWNKEQVVTKVLDYNSKTTLGCTYGLFSYEIS